MSKFTEKDAKILASALEVLKGLQYKRIEDANPYKAPNIKQGPRFWQKNNISISNPFSRTRNGRNRTELDVTNASGSDNPITSKKQGSIKKGSVTLHTNKLKSKKAEVDITLDESGKPIYVLGKKTGTKKGLIIGTAAGTAGTLGLQELKDYYEREALKRMKKRKKNG